LVILESDIRDIYRAAHLQEKLRDINNDTTMAQHNSRLHPYFAELVSSAERQRWERYLPLLEAHIRKFRGLWVIVKDGTTGAPDLDCANDPPPPPVQCDICFEEIDEDELSLGWACESCENGFWCRSCTATTFRNAQVIKMPSCKCGQKALTILEIYHLMPGDWLREHAERLLVLSAKKPLYCAKETCNKFLRDNTARTKPESSTKAVLCEDCGTRTCSRCQELITAHGGNELCPADNLNEIRRQLTVGTPMAECRCGNVIERKDACRHMICSYYRYEFCIICKKEWEACDCP